MPSSYDAQPLFAPYFERTGISSSNISGQTFELLVAAWRGDLARAEEQREVLTEGQNVLAESGFLMAVRDGRIRHEEAA